MFFFLLVEKFAFTRIMHDLWMNTFQCTFIYYAKYFIFLPSYVLHDFAGSKENCEETKKSQDTLCEVAFVSDILLIFARYATKINVEMVLMFFAATFCSGSLTFLCDWCAVCSGFSPFFFTFRAFLFMYPARQMVNNRCKFGQMSGTKQRRNDISNQIQMLCTQSIVYHVLS